MQSKSKIRPGLSRAYARALDWLFPPRCAGCGQLGDHWCPNCREATQPLADPLCLKCGSPLAAPDVECSACSQHEFAFTSARSWAPYAGELRQAILKLKHRRNIALGEELAHSLVKVVRLQDWKIDVIVPIPLAPARFAERGFNQVDLLTTPLGGQLKLPVVVTGLQRKLETAPQIDLTVNQRWENVRFAFTGDPQQLRARSVLLVDDIMTTGATLDAAARVTLNAGAKDVYALTLARTLLEGTPHVW